MLYCTSRSNETRQEVLTFVVKSLGLLEHYRAKSKTTVEFEDRKANILELQQSSAQYDKEAPSLGEQSLPDSINQNDGDYDDDPPISPLAKFLENVALVKDLAESKFTHSTTTTNRF
jgi:superfamily I DNA/RNA helicase